MPEEKYLLCSCNVCLHAWHCRRRPGGADSSDMWRWQRRNTNKRWYLWSKGTYIDEELADILALVSLQLDHFTILWVLNHCPIAGKLLLWDKRRRAAQISVSGSENTTLHSALYVNQTLTSCRNRPWANNCPSCWYWAWHQQHGKKNTAEGLKSSWNGLLLCRLPAETFCLGRTGERSQAQINRVSLGGGRIWRDRQMRGCL